MILLINFGFLLKLKLKLSSLTLLKIDKIIQLITLSKACMENIFQIQLSTYFFKLQDYWLCGFWKLLQLKSIPFIVLFVLSEYTL